MPSDGEVVGSQEVSALIGEGEIREHSDKLWKDQGWQCTGEYGVWQPQSLQLSSQQSNDRNIKKLLIEIYKDIVLCFSSFSFVIKACTRGMVRDHLVFPLSMMRIMMAKVNTISRIQFFQCRGELWASRKLINFEKKIPPKKEQMRVQVYLIIICIYCNILEYICDTSQNA